MKISQGLAPRARRPVYKPLEMPLQSRPGRHKHDGDTRLINCYAEEAGREGKIPFPLYPTDGLKSFATLTDGGATRGILATESTLYVCSGRQAYAVDPGGAITVLGGIPSDGPVFIVRNRANPQEIIWVADGLTFRNTGPNDFAQLNDPDLPAPTSADFIDGYTLYFSRDGRLTYSGIDDADDIDALAFATAEGSPDELIRGFVHNRSILLLGAETTEVWDSTGDVDSPFQRSPGAFYETGCMAPATAASLDAGPAWVDHNGRVVLANLGGGFKRISTHSVERSIDKLSLANKALMEASVYERRGHEFYVLNGADFTWIFDTATGMWHERETQGKDRWCAGHIVLFNGKYICGDCEDGKLYELDPDTHDEAGTEMTMTMRFPINAWPYAVRLDRLRFDMVPGQGLNAGTPHNDDPQFMLRLSRNGGASYGNERQRSIGKIGQYGAEVKFSKLGTSTEDGWIVEGRVSAAVIRAFLGVSGDVVVKRR